LGAQNQRLPNDPERGALLQRNAGMAKKIVTGSLTLARPSSSALQRSTSYRDVILTLEEEIKTAAEAGDAERVVELTKHVTELMEKGLLPNLTKARSLISGGSPDEEKLFELRNFADRMTKDIDAAIKGRGDVSAKASVEAELKRLSSLRADVKKVLLNPELNAHQDAGGAPK
jgi:hypothetical protein